MIGKRHSGRRTYGRTTYVTRVSIRCPDILLIEKVLLVFPRFPMPIYLRKVRRQFSLPHIAVRPFREVRVNDPLHHMHELVSSPCMD
jgi:hypothetical protein